MKAPYTKSGKCGDTVWQRNRYGQISYAFFIPANPKSAAQLFVRGNFGAVSARWRTLSEQQRVSWCVAGKSKKTRRRLGQCWPLPGFSYFVKTNVWLVNRGQPQVDLPPVEPQPPRPDLPLLSHALFLQAYQLRTASPHTPPGYAGGAPAPGG